MRPATRLAALLLASLVLAWPLEVLSGFPVALPAAEHQAVQVAILLVGASVLASRRRTSSALAGTVFVGTVVLAATALLAPLPLPEDVTQRRLLTAGLELIAALIVIHVLLAPVFLGRTPPLATATHLAWVLGIYVVLEFAAAAADGFVAAAFPHGVPAIPIPSMIGSLVIELLMLLCVVALVGGVAPLGWRALGFTRLPVARVLIIGVAIGVVNMLVSAAVRQIAEQLGLDPAHAGNAPSLPPGVPRPTVALAVVSSSLLPGAAEELFFRGALFGVLLRTRSPLWLAITLPSALFALAHLQSTMLPLQVVSLGVGFFLVAAVLAVTYQRTGSLYTCILAHAIFNLPASMSLALGEERSQQLSELIVVAGVLAWAWLLKDAWRGEADAERAAGTYSRWIRKLLTWLNPRLDVGSVEIRPTLHLLPVVILAAYIGLLAPDAPNPLALAVLFYGLVQGAACASRGARILVALHYRRRLKSIRLAPLLAVRFSDDDPPAAVRRTAAGATAALALYGTALLSAGAWLGASWAAVIQESVVQIGWWCVMISVVDLLPIGLPGVAVAHELWTWTWRPRQTWLAYTPALALLLGASVLVSLQFPSGYTRQMLDFVLRDLVAMSMLLLSTLVMCLTIGSRHARPQLGTSRSVQR